MAAKIKNKKNEAKAESTVKLPEFEPLQVSMASDDDYPTTRRRRNVVAITEREFRFKNLEDGITPFKYDKNYSGSNTCSIYEMVILCQKAYWNYGPLRVITELKVDFSSTDIYLKGSTAKIRKFYQAWFEKINLFKLESQFFREYYRSGNVFLYPHKAKLKEADLRNLVKYYGNSSVASAVVPIRYIILNPADIQTTGSLSIGNNRVFYKRISDYEIESLRNPRTEQDKQVFESLPEEIRKQIKTNVAQVLMPLPMADIVYVPFCKNDYEPLSVSPLWGALEDINYKMELKKIDMALSRSTQQSMLLLTCGSLEGGVNQNTITALQKLLENNTVSRAIVADYSVKGEFLNPDISELLSPEKYTVVDKDIDMSLCNILAGGEKFANQKNKIDVFLAQLEQGRKVFLNEFLKPEMIKLAEEMGFESVPTPYFDAISLSDDANKMRIYNRLIELGVLTPEQGLQAIETGRLPDGMEMEEAQKLYKQARNNGYYEPLVGGSRVQEEGGRPVGTSGIPQSTKKIGQIGSGEAKFSLVKITENLSLANKLDRLIQKRLKSKFKLKELSEEQESLVPEIKNLILANHKPDEWISKVEVYCDRPVDTDKQRVGEIHELAIKHQVNTSMAAILFASQE